MATMVYFPQQVFDKIITYCGDLTKKKQMERHAELVKNINMFSKDWLFIYYKQFEDYVRNWWTPYGWHQNQTKQQLVENIIDIYITQHVWKYDLELDYKPYNFCSPYMIQDELPVTEEIEQEYGDFRCVDALTYKK